MLFLFKEVQSRCFSGNNEVVLLELIYFTFLQNCVENDCTKKAFWFGGFKGCIGCIGFWNNLF
jgi:hypothetical protein